MSTLDHSLPGEKKTPMLAPSLQYGVLLALASIVWLLLAHFLSLNFDGWLNKFAGWIISIVGLSLVILHFRDKLNNGKLSLGQGVKLSVLTGLWSGLIYSIFFYIFLTYVSPTILDTIKEAAINSMAEQGLSDTQIEQAMHTAGYFLSPAFMSLSIILGSLFSSALLGLIISAILKKD
ncbi:MAG: DUF4199 domain-containing protein [Crocinitomicaceae bacterium]|nr:DUF4199 domain-containing protein [Crocinitomicaceae bacterium]